MNKRLSLKILGLIFAFLISVFLSSLITFCLMQIFLKQPEEILNINVFEVLETVKSSKESIQIFVLTIISFMLFATVSIFKFFRTKNYHSKTYKVTDNIEIPLPVGGKQTQHGSVWWLNKKNFKKTFGTNTIDTENPTIQELLSKSDDDREVLIKSDNDESVKVSLDVESLPEELRKPIFKKGGLVVGKKDRTIFKPYIKNIKIPKTTKHLKIPSIKARKVEDIYFIDDDLHSLTIGATRSGKTRSLVLQSINNTALAGENMIISDPKGELFEYTCVELKRLGYNVLTLDFKTPLKSSKYNFLQPVIEAIKQKNTPKAENYASDIVQSLVGDVKGNGEAIWNNGEKAVIRATIMAVVMENIDNPKLQNLPNVYHFIAEMCKEQEDKTTLIDTYLDFLKEVDKTHPAIASFAPAQMAASKTRASFYTSALSTLNIFMDSYVASMISENEIDINKFNEEKTALFMILPDEKTTFYGLCSLFVNQVYTKLVEMADEKGGRLKIRTNFILDEFGNFSAIPNFGGFLTVGGGRGIRFNLFVQSFSQLNEKYGDNTAQNILDNCYVWNYLKTSNETTAEKISKKIGTYTTTSWSESSDKKSDNGGSNSMNLISRALLTPDEILRLQRPYLLVMCSGTEPAITNAPDLSKWTFNKLLGLGDKNWNIKVRQKREDAREIKEISPLELWDIDKQTMELKQKKKEQELEERRLNFMKRQGAIEYPKGNL